MESIKIHAAFLLFVRVLTVAFLISVLVIQIKMYKTTDTDYPFVRRLLSSLVAVGLLGCILPIVIDVSTLLDKTYTGKLLVPYAHSNALSLLGMAVGFRILYKHVASQRVTLTAKEKHAREKAAVKKNKN